jgi:hypothetical protein
MMNWKAFGRKQSWPNFKELSRNSPGVSEENHVKPVRMPVCGYGDAFGGVCRGLRLAGIWLQSW